MKELTCISCPMGCALKVELNEKGEAVSVSGNLCKRGEVYGKKEVTAPTRTVTSTVLVTGSDKPVVSVRTKTDIPKEKIMACMDAIKQVSVQAPVHIGDVILADIAGTGVDLIATAGANPRGA